MLFRATRSLYDAGFYQNNGGGSLIEQIMGTIFIKNSLSHMNFVNVDSMCDLKLTIVLTHQG